MNRCHTWVTVAVLLIIGQSAVRAQVSRTPGRVWSVSVAAGDVCLSESAQGVDAAMRAGGFDDPSSCWFFCTGTTDHPFSIKTNGGTWLATVCRRFGKIAHVSVVMGRTKLGQTHGYKARQLFGDYVALEQSVRTYAIMVGVNGEAGAAWVAAGPALHQVALEHRESAGGPAVTADRLGAVAAIGVAFPARRRFFIELQAQYRLVGTVDLGPIDVTRTNGDIAGTLPRTAVNFNHAIWLIGFGIRL